MATAATPGPAMVGSGNDYLRIVLGTGGRKAVEAVVQAGIELLDAIDGDADDEDGDEDREHDGREADDLVADELAQ